MIPWREANRFVIARRPEADVAISQYPAASWESYRRNRNCLPEIATAPLGPRNDKSGAFTIVTATGTSRSCGAGRGQPGPYKARAFARRSVQIGSAFPRLPRPRWGLAMTNLLTLRHRIRAAKPTACKAVT